MKCFIAIELPEHIQAEIFHVFEKFREGGLVVGNFVEKENLHLTLKFLGELSEEEIKEIKKGLSEITFDKFETETGKIGFFPNEDYIRILWIELIGEKISELHKKIDNKLFESGFKKEERKFSSHITTARIKSVKDRKIFLQKIRGIKLKKEKFIINSFSLIKSELVSYGKKGCPKENCPVYKTLEKFEGK